MQARPIRNPRELGRVILAGAAPSGRHVKGTPVRWGRLGTTYALGWPEGVHAGQERLGLLGSHMRIFRSMAGPDVCYKPNSCRRTQSTQRVRRSQTIALAFVFAVALPLRSICSCPDGIPACTRAPHCSGGRSIRLDREGACRTRVIHAKAKWRLAALIVRALSWQVAAG